MPKKELTPRQKMYRKAIAKARALGRKARRGCRSSRYPQKGVVCPYKRADMLAAWLDGWRKEGSKLKYMTPVQQRIAKRKAGVAKRVVKPAKKPGKVERPPAKQKARAKMIKKLVANRRAKRAKKAK